MLSFRWVNILSGKLGMNQQRHDKAQAENVAGLDITGHGNQANHLFPAGEAVDGQSLEINWDY